MGNVPKLKQFLQGKPGKNWTVVVGNAHCQREAT